MLADLVRRCRSTDDLRGLFVHLGYESDDAPAADGWRAVARWRTFRVVAAPADDPGAAVRAMARRLAATAQPGLVAAVGTQTLALATPRLGTAASGPVLAVDLGRPDRIQLQLLAELAPRAGSTALDHALRVAEVLASEGVSDRFFEAFRALLHQAQAAVKPSVPDADRALLALLPLTRVLFLYFVQAKGWLDGRSDFLRTALDDALARRQRFHRAVLHPLFFGTLNRPPARRTSAPFGCIPYLNGGLFEPHPAERVHGAVTLSNLFWRDAFDQVFERFRFCVREGEQVDAIAPDMLGRTFERIMQRGERRRSGTFYTPEALVRELVTATLATAIAGPGFSPAAAQALLAGTPMRDVRRRVLVRRLLALRILDPAVGSGAFLLGALDVLTETWAGLGVGGTRAGRVALRRRIVARQLYGVDVNPVAVRLAELRLWLAMIADESESRPARVAPLPNLNGVIRQGDTLLDPVGAARALGVHAWATGSAKVATVRQRVFTARGPARAPALAALRDAELAAAREQVQGAIANVRAALRDLTAAAAGRDLFGRRSGLTGAQQARRRQLRAELQALRRAARQVSHGVVPFFSFEVHYPRVVARGGFDAVIGNPPWVRAERLPPRTRGTLATRFSWWRPERRRGFVHQPDLAVAFLERAVELARPGGAVGFLLPSKIVSAGYAETARRALVRETSLAYLHRVPERTARAFRAAVYPLAAVLRAQPPSPTHTVHLDFAGRSALSQARLAVRGPWMLVGDRQRDALDRLCAAGTPLGTAAPPLLGVKTGADSALLGQLLDTSGAVATVRLKGEEVTLETEVLRPAVRGRDLRAFDASLGQSVLFPYDPAGGLRRALPPLAARWVRRHRATLERRADFTGGPPWVLFRTAAAFAKHRVAWPDLARAPHAVALIGRLADVVPMNTCYVSPTPDPETALTIAALLNSTWIRTLLRVRADEARGGFRRHNARAMSTVPVPAQGPARDRLVSLSRHAHQHHDVCQQDLDHAVAVALGLPAETRGSLAALADDLG